MLRFRFFQSNDISEHGNKAFLAFLQVDGATAQPAGAKMTVRNMEIILYHLEMCNHESKMNRWIKSNYGPVIVVINSQSHRGLRATQCPIRFRFKYSWGTSGVCLNTRMASHGGHSCVSRYSPFYRIRHRDSTGCFCQHKVCLQLFKSGSDSQPLMWLLLW